MSHQEFISYQPEDNSLSPITVLIEDETIWLTQAQMMELFAVSKQNISLHINNIFKEEELVKNSVVKYSLTTASDGKKYKTIYYNLDVIISIGYRVKSKRGTQFRIWANKVLKDYLLKGYAIQQRMEQIERRVWQHDQQLELLVHKALPPKEGIFFDGQIFDAYQFVTSLIKTAKKSITVIDNYPDETVLTMLSKRNKGVTAQVYTHKVSNQFALDIEKFNAQYEKIEVGLYTKSHDRFLINDDKVIYHFGASLKDLGKKWFAFSKLEIDVELLFEKLNK